MKSIINILILEYEPLFTDGRVVRVKSLIDYLLSIGMDTSLFSLGENNNIQRNQGFVHHQIKYLAMRLIPQEVSKKVPKHRLLFNDMLKLLSNLLFPDRYIFSLLTVSRRLRSVLNEGDTLIISMPRFSPLMLCAFPILIPEGINIILDYRDLWVNNKIFIRSFLTKALAGWIENRALSRCSLVMVTTDSAKEYFNGIGHDAIVISNGITQADMDNINMYRRNSINSTKLSNEIMLGYFGNLGGNRDCSNLLYLLKDNKFNISVYGNLDSDHLLACQDSYKGSLSREGCLIESSHCDVLMVVIRKAENSDYAIPGKIYECVAFDKPIIMFCPSDAVALSYLQEINYPHLHIDSEDVTVLNDKLVAAINTFYEECTKHHTDREWEIPIRNKEYEKLHRILEKMDFI